jgi:hypothetical protein
LRGVRQAPVGGLERFFYNSFENLLFLYPKPLSHFADPEILRVNHLILMPVKAAVAQQAFTWSSQNGPKVNSLIEKYARTGCHCVSFAVCSAAIRVKARPYQCATFYG